MARVSPPGGQRGTVVEVEFTGRALEQPKDVLFYEPGISVESLAMVETALLNGKSVAVEPGYRVKAKLKLAADCPLGAHGMRLRTSGGLTEYVRFFVGPFPTVDDIIVLATTDVDQDGRRELILYGPHAAGWGVAVVEYWASGITYAFHCDDH